MRLEFTQPVTAADTSRRSISGRVVTWGEQGNTSAGPAVFEPGSLTAAETVVLRLEHDRTRPLGKAVHLAANEEGIDGVFRVAKTQAGSDALIEAAEELRAGLSVGATVEQSYLDDDGVMHVTAAEFDEVSLVTHPAIHSARVAQVAASEGTTDPGNEPEPEGKENEMTDQETPVVAEAAAPDTEQMQASELASIAPTAPRLEFADAADYLSTAVRGLAMGDQAAASRVMAAAQTTGDNPGVVPELIVGPIIDYIQRDRPVCNASRWVGMPNAGTTFVRPFVDQHTTAGIQNGENTALPSQKMNVKRLTVSKETLGGSITLTFQDRDWTDPAIMSVLLMDMAAAYGIQCETHICNTLVNNTSSDVVSLAAPGSAKAEDYISAVAQASQKVYDKILRLPTHIYLSTDKWAEFISLTDSTGRPLFPRVGARNAPGVSDAVTDFRLDVMGLNAVVSPQLPTNTIIVGHGESLESYETLGGQVSIVNPSVLSVDMAFYGYWGDLVVTSDAFVAINQASSAGRK